MKTEKISRLVVVVLCAGLVLVGSVAYALNFPGLGGAEKVKAVNGVVSIPLAKVTDGKAHYFKFADGGKDLAFFIVKASNGSIKAAFDACDVCYKEKKGYEQQGNSMLCRNCRKKFAIDRIGPNASGGCNPASLVHREADGKVIISVEDLKTGGRFF